MSNKIIKRTISGLPSQKLSFKDKNEDWRKANVDWGDKKSWFYDSHVRKSFINKRINYDLWNGKIHMEDIKRVLDPGCFNMSFIPDNIQHFPIINDKIQVLLGEELARQSDYHVVVTNPNAVSEISEKRKKKYRELVEELINSEAETEEDFEIGLKKIDKYINYEWKDIRELRGNELLNHYKKELNMDLMFNDGFLDVAIVGEEIYQCRIVGGEPYVLKLNPRKVHVLKSGYSNKIEDADVIIIDDYWSPAKILDYYHEELTEKDVEKLENLNSFGDTSNGLDHYDDRANFIHKYDVYDSENVMNGDGTSDSFVFMGGVNSPSSNYYDTVGNIRVLQVFWKSKRLVLKVKKFDKETGEEIFDYFPENYILNKELGEEIVSRDWINEAWQGTKIGKDIYVDIKPCPIQYWRMSNPSKCHFGIIGSIYNTNETRVYSLVDMMKEFQYQYDIHWDRLNRVLSRNHGKIITLDTAFIPTGWTMEKWMSFLVNAGIKVKDSFKEGNIGASTGKLAGNLNNNTNEVLDTETGAFIQQSLQMLEFIKSEMAHLIGVPPQRAGAVSNRETVGGVEVAVRQGSFITERYYAIHNDVKRRVYNAFLDTAKYALRGKKLKFKNILSGYVSKIFEIDGDEFSECDYGVIADNSSNTLAFNQHLNSLAQAGLQNGLITFSTSAKLYSSMSLAEKQRMIEQSEEEMLQRQQQQSQIDEKIATEELNFKKSLEESKLKLETYLAELKKYEIDQNNSTRLAVAEMQTYNRSEDKDFNNNNISDPFEIHNQALKEQELKSKERNELDKNKLKAIEQQIKLVEIEEKNKTERYKVDKTLEIAKENKNRYDSK